MKFLISLFLYFILFQAVSQGPATYQSQEIYKKKGVKVRRWYTGTNKVLDKITWYDREGRLIIEYNPLMITYYRYNPNGQLIEKTDTIFGKKDQPKQVGLYVLEYSNQELIKVTRWNPDYTLSYITRYEKSEKLQITECYNPNAIIYSQDTAEYDNQNLKVKFYGCDKSSHHCWNSSYIYHYDKNKNIVKKTWLNYGEPAGEIYFFYNDKGLLARTESKLAPEFFEYEYYE